MKLAKPILFLTLFALSIPSFGQVQSLKINLRLSQNYVETLRNSGFREIKAEANSRFDFSSNPAVAFQNITGFPGSHVQETEFSLNSEPHLLHLKMEEAPIATHEAVRFRYRNIEISLSGKKDQNWEDLSTFRTEQRRSGQIVYFSSKLLDLPQLLKLSPTDEPYPIELSADVLVTRDTMQGYIGGEYFSDEFLSFNYSRVMHRFIPPEQ